MFAMALRGPVSAAMIQAKASTTQVRSAVATSESVVLIPHFARIEVIPAKKADANAARIQDKAASFHGRYLHLIIRPFLVCGEGEAETPIDGIGEVALLVGAGKETRGRECDRGDESLSDAWEGKGLTGQIRSGIVCSVLRVMACVRTVKIKGL